MEPKDSEAHYSERLVKLKDLTTYYYRPEPPERAYSRADFGLADDVHLYLFPQTLFKIHPDFDQVFGDLLERDPRGHLVLIDDPFGGHWRDLLMKRLRAAIPDVAGRIEFVPKAPLKDYFGLLTVAAAVLDVATEGWRAAAHRQIADRTALTSLSAKKRLVPSVAIPLGCASAASVCGPSTRSSLPEPA